MTPNRQVDEYVDQSTHWPAEIAALRPIFRDCGLVEAVKWRKPCYSHDGSNILILQEMKNFLAIMFFKGALIDDVDGVLEDQGPNSRSARRICVTSVDDVNRLTGTVTTYVMHAVAIEEAGLEVGPAPEPELVEELQRRLDDDPALRTAFDALTPGRQREYNLYLSGAKQASTRASRVEKYVPKILAGKGFRDL